MKLISLSQGKFAKIDDQDFDRVNQFKWFYSPRHGACKHLNRKIFKTDLLMHRLILDAPKHLIVDHINGDKLDNRRKNIRLCTHADNMRNRRPGKNLSGYKGVRKNGSKWQSYIMFNRKFINLGQFKTREEAALAYNKAAKVYFGEYAWPNKIKNNGKQSKSTRLESYSC